MDRSDDSGTVEHSSSHSDSHGFVSRRSGVRIPALAPGSENQPNHALTLDPSPGAVALGDGRDRADSSAPSGNEDEAWRPVVGAEYEVSDLGRVRRAGKVLKDRPHTRGYRIVDISTAGRAVSKTVHGLVAEAFIGPRPLGLTVDHVDTDKTNNRATNLEYVTRLENNRRRDAHRAAASGQAVSP